MLHKRDVNIDKFDPYHKATKEITITIRTETINVHGISRVQGPEGQK